jgi:hypothetical protein
MPGVLGAWTNGIVWFCSVSCRERPLEPGQLAWQEAQGEKLRAKPARAR